MQRLPVILIAALAVSAGCEIGRAPALPSNITTARAAGSPGASESPVVTTWQCLAATVFRPADCPPARLVLPSVTSGAVTAPGAPGALTSIVSGSTVQLSWVAPSGGDAPSSYLIEAGSASGLSNLASFDTGSAAVSLTVSAMPAGTYFVRVRGRNSAGTGGASGEITVVVSGGPSPCVGPPGTPTGLASSVTGTSVTITWNSAVTGCAATGYVIEAGSSTGLANLANFNTGSTSTSLSATGVAAGTYFVRVRAANGSGTSGPSNEITVTVSGTPPPPPCTSPAAPANFAASVNGTTVTLTWSAASGSPTSYVVEVGTSAGSSNISSSDTGNTQTSMSATLAPGTYFARVKGKNACGTGAASNEVTFTVSAPPCTLPSAPAGLAATVNGSSIFLSWNAAGGAPTSYIVEIGTSSGASDIASTDTGNATTSATTGTLPAGTYFIRVRAKNACGTSNVSNQVTATIVAATPAVVTITSSGVSPRNLTVTVGTQVTFVNNDTRTHNMASNPHPEHTDCPELNQVGFLTVGQSRQTGNLNTPKTCGYHDHDNAFNSALQGTITITN